MMGGGVNRGDSGERVGDSGRGSHPAVSQLPGSSPVIKGIGKSEAD